MEKMVWFSVIGNGVWLEITGIQPPFDDIPGQALETGLFIYYSKRDRREQ
jgi:hypothetical protein